MHMTIRVVLAEVIIEPYEKLLVDQRFEELEELVDTYWGFSVVKIVQQRAVPDYKTYIWSGKLEEIKNLMIEQEAPLLIIGNMLKAQQIYTVNEYLKPFGLEARDRVDLILKIFDRHAVTTEARMQIELAAIKHMGPRIFGMGMELSRQWWGSTNARGLGETNTEVMKRHLAKKTLQIEESLKQYEQVRATHRQARRRNHLPTIGLAWYTNAWKSTLMNALTHKGVYVADKLFATLGTNVGQLYFPSMSGKWETILVNDTIGFMRDLPPQLITAFKSTLEDSIESDLLLHVIDAHDPLVHDKVRVVDEILEQIWATQERIYIFNKTDLVSPPELRELKAAYKDYPTLWISAQSWNAIDELKKICAQKLVARELDDQGYLVENDPSASGISNKE